MAQNMISEKATPAVQVIGQVVRKSEKLDASRQEQLRKHILELL